MAINLPDPGNGIPEQKTGNDEWTNMKIVRDNFADQSNAASRLVGMSSGNVPEIVGKTGVAGAGLGGTSFKILNPDFNFLKEDLANGTYAINSNYKDLTYLPFGANDFANITVFNASAGDRTVFWSSRVAWRQRFAARTVQVRTSQSPNLGEWAEFYTTSNTTTDVNKNIKTSSPVLQVFKDGVKKIHEANELPIKFTRNGVGDYTIEGTTGLRENDWQIVIPKDDHDNQMIAFTMEDDNGTIHLKTYKRTFSMEAFLFGPDLSAPVDIPDGLWVDLHFNDIPQEQTDEPTI